MFYTKSPYLCGPNILDVPERAVKEVALDFAGADCIKAGTPISEDGKVANDATAMGVLLNDVHSTCGCGRGLVVIAGRIKTDVAAENSGIVISDEAKSALVNIAFTGDGARMGGGVEILICNLIATATSPTDCTYECDKTGEELYDAVLAGKVVVLKYINGGSIDKDPSAFSYLYLKKPYVEGGYSNNVLVPTVIGAEFYDLTNDCPKIVRIATTLATGAEAITERTNDIILKGSGGGWYKISVDGSGNVVAAIYD